MKIRQVQIFHDDNTMELQRQINDWLKQNQSAEIISILQSQSPEGSVHPNDGFMHSWFTITIVYLDEMGKE